MNDAKPIRRKMRARKNNTPSPDLADMVEGRVKRALDGRSIILVGLMGAGKSTVGRRLAARLGLRFRDADNEIEAAAGMSISDIFARDGEAFFRRKEEQVIARLLAGPPGVLSTGGGAFLSPATREAVGRAGMSVWLRADPALLWSRVRHKSHRPLLAGPDGRARLEALCAERAPVYALADLVVDCAPGRSVEQMAATVIDRIAASRPDVLRQAAS